MMKQVSAGIFAFLNETPEFTAVIGEYQGGRKLYPLGAKGDTPLPFATYRIREQNGETKDAQSYIVVLATVFNDYDACVEFSDALTPIIKNARDFDWESSEPDQDEETGLYISFINFKITK